RGGGSGLSSSSIRTGGASCGGTACFRVSGSGSTSASSGSGGSRCSAGARRTSGRAMRRGRGGAMRRSRGRTVGRGGRRTVGGGGSRGAVRGRRGWGMRSGGGGMWGRSGFGGSRLLVGGREHPASEDRRSDDRQATRGPAPHGRLGDDSRIR